MKKILLILSFFILVCICGCARECTHENMVQELIAPTCDQSGYLQHSCSQCSLQYQTDMTPPLGHTLSETVIEPTCEEGGYTQVTCTVCHASYQDNLTLPLGHCLDSIITPPTCADAGYTIATCSLCDFSYQSQHAPPIAHQLTETVTAPTCTAEGYTQQKCSQCDFSLQTHFVAPTGHQYTVSVTKPTRQKSGKLVYTCHCEYSFTNYLFYSDVFLGAAVNENQTILAKGVDVSKWQHTVRADGSYAPLNWTAIRSAGFDFAILKAGSTPRENAGGIDPVFEMNYRDAKAVGMELGAYFYTYATTTDAVRADVALLISWLQDKQFEYPIYFDLEDPSLSELGRDTLTEFCEIFISTLQENGFYGALYSGQPWLDNYLNQDALRGVYDIWYARYPTLSSDPVLPSAVFHWNDEKYGVQLGLWQYTQYGTIPGIENVSFDFNYAYRDYPTLIKTYGYNGFEPQIGIT